MQTDTHTQTSNKAAIKASNTKKPVSKPITTLFCYLPDLVVSAETDPVGNGTVLLHLLSQNLFDLQ